MISWGKLPPKNQKGSTQVLSNLGEAWSPQHSAPAEGGGEEGTLLEFTHSACVSLWLV